MTSSPTISNISNDVETKAIYESTNDTQISEKFPVADAGVAEHISKDEEDAPSPTEDEVDAAEQQSWNQPRRNAFRVAACFYSFLVFGMNDAAYGALVPYLEIYYNLSYTIVSLIFLSPFAGYTLAAFLNARVHTTLGQRGIAILAPLCHLVAYIVISTHPPYAAVVVMYAIAGFGYGLIDAGWSAWLGGMKSANAVQGFLHSCYSLGATLSPLIATSMITKLGLPWYAFYWFMIGCATLSLVLLTTAFWDKSGAAYRVENPPEEGKEEGGRTREALKNRITWICAIYFFTYVGAEGLCSLTFQAQRIG